MDRSFTRIIIRYEIEEIIKAEESDIENNGRFDFASSLKDVKNRIVQESRVMTEIEFDDLCRDILEDREDT